MKFNRIDSLRPSVALIRLRSLCTKEPTRLQSLGFLVRLSLRVREKWLHGERQQWPPVRFTRARHTALGTAVQYNRSFHIWRCSSVLSASIKVSRSLCNFVFLPLSLESLLTVPRIFEGLRVCHTQRGTCALDAPLPFSFFSLIFLRSAP